eukprot:scaffold1707_cov39-Cyclotella_meneghiniana.AAC.8
MLKYKGSEIAPLHFGFEDASCRAIDQQSICTKSETPHATHNAFKWKSFCYGDPLSVTADQVKYMDFTLSMIH